MVSIEWRTCSDGFELAALSVSPEPVLVKLKVQVTRVEQPRLVPAEQALSTRKLSRRPSGAPPLAFSLFLPTAFQPSQQADKGKRAPHPEHRAPRAPLSSPPVPRRE